MELELTVEQEQRFAQLSDALKLVGLVVRQDSELCWDFILYGDEAKVTTDVADISQRMAKAEYLHKYCDFQLGYEIAQNTAKKRVKSGQPLLPQQHWFQCINECVLQTTLLGTYPDVWPWLMEDTYSPDQWRRANTAPEWEQKTA
jgi:hypothetical protein